MRVRLPAGVSAEACSAAAAMMMAQVQHDPSWPGPAILSGPGVSGPELSVAMRDRYRQASWQDVVTLFAR